MRNSLAVWRDEARARLQALSTEPEIIHTLDQREYSAELGKRFVYSEAQAWIFFGSRSKGRRRFFPKGRRAGITRGGAHAFVEWALEGDPCLWGDTVDGNIQRYFDRYFRTALRKLKLKQAEDWTYNAQKKTLYFIKSGGFIDFRSATHPENWEGFGYRHILLNEAGIIMADPNLYQESVLPMLLDYPDSEIICAGVPKGKNLFADEIKKALDGEPGYYTPASHMEPLPGQKHFAYCVFHNPWINQPAAQKFVDEMPSRVRQQEGLGQILEDVIGALWKSEYYNKPGFRLTKAPPMKRVVIGVDPNASNSERSDEMGIVPSGRSFDDKLIVLADRTLRGSVNQRAAAVVKAFYDFEADSVVLEVNNGGDWIPAAIANIDKQVAASCILVHASRGKLTRAEPTAGRYEKGEAHHVGQLSELEAEQTGWIPGNSSPNRMDAGVWADWALFGNATELEPMPEIAGWSV